jgi:hypothetical protein
MQPPVPFAAFRSTSAGKPGVVAVGMLLMSQALAQPEAAVAELRQPYSAACLAQARALIRDAAVAEAGLASATLRRVPEATAAALARSGVARGDLNLLSLISPPSTFVLYQLPQRDGAGTSDSCPLHETYLGIRQGGFVPQPLRFYGPLRAADA